MKYYYILSIRASNKNGNITGYLEKDLVKQHNKTIYVAPEPLQIYTGT
jgi:hypothetical protein